MYREYYPKKWKLGVIKSRIIVIIGLIAAAVIIISLILFPKAAGYFERKAIEKLNEETLQEIQDIKKSDNSMNSAKNDGGVKRVNEMTSELPATPFVSQKPVIILEKAYIEVPFVCQAPFQTEANWIYHEESCEEAALLQVQYFLNGAKEVNRQSAHDEILNMIDWEIKNLGSHHDLYGEEMKKFIMGYYGYKNHEVAIIKSATIDDIKKEISKGNPVIVPIMGHLLRNPYYPYPGYHMLTVIGYTSGNIITNDVGTRMGKDFSYPYQRFYDAMAAAGAEILVITPEK